MDRTTKPDRGPLGERISRLGAATFVVLAIILMAGSLTNTGAMVFGAKSQSIASNFRSTQ